MNDEAQPVEEGSPLDEAHSKIDAIIDEVTEAMDHPIGPVGDLAEYMFTCFLLRCRLWNVDGEAAKKAIAGMITRAWERSERSAFEFRKSHDNEKITH